MQKRWNLKKANEEEVLALHESLKIHSALCRILIQRGFDTFEKAKSYFRPQLSHLHSSWLMKDMDIAVMRIEEAINNKKNILVFGDYDVDGTTAVACVYRFLKNQYHNVEFYIRIVIKKVMAFPKQELILPKKTTIPLSFHSTAE
jgi:single-stranded-DNA-specific exonuclease